MTAKEYLSQAYKIDNDINSKLEQVASLRDLATKATSTMSDMPGSPNRNIHKMEDAIVKIIALEDEINSDIHELISADSITFTKFLTAVAARTGEILNYANIAGDVGVSEPTVKTWLSILERTGIVYLLQPYSASVLTRAIKAPKVYFKDTGLACYLSRWLSADALKNSAVAGNMFETFIVSEILKSYTNEGKDYRSQIFYYRGKDKKASIENEIDLIIEENGIIYPVEIKMTGNPKASMASANTVLDRIPDKKRGNGIILCLIDRKTYLRENLIALPITYI